MYRRPTSEVLAALRYCLQVMEEDSHRGLDDKDADSLRALLLRRIAKVEDALKREQALGGDRATMPQKLD